MVSLADIAREVGVNVSVVSRALSLRPDRHSVVRKETREQIRSVAKRLGYIPNRQASFAARGESATILCFLPEISDRLTADLMFGIAQEAGSENFPVTFVRGTAERDFGAFLQQMCSREHSGVLSYPPSKLAAESRKLLSEYHAKRNTMLLLNVYRDMESNPLDKEFSGIPQVCIDDYYGGQLAARHLLACGCTCFYISWMPPLQYTKRLDGFRDALEAAGHAVAGELLTQADLAPLRDPRGPRVGIYADRDVQAFQLEVMLARAGIVPGEGRILLVGNDDKQEAQYSLPSLTTIHQPTLEEGRLAVRKLIHLIFGQDEATELLKPWLVLRQSTGNFGPEAILH